jgi:tyrosine decarboxylase / aspartate 1-decarboxylase
MYKIWEKKSQEKIKSRVFKALAQNVNYDNQHVLGIPASYLDEKVFWNDESFLRDAPFISTLIKNPNHIGCHTLGESESYFKGTQDIEKELLELCSVDILNGKANEQDGYVASGGTEANMQAIWIYRNYFINKLAAGREEICIICSEDNHYSIDKAANIFVLDLYKVPVQDDTRELSPEDIKETIRKANSDGKKNFIVICNMMTTMFGSVDNVNDYADALRQLDCEFKIHIDGAFGGFYYPFTEVQNPLTFQNPDISSFTLDAHKMAQAPYGTGIFLIRKGFMEYTTTKKASYVQGDDSTLIGSRSGANAIAVWMILMKHGPYGWKEKIFILQKRTEWVCKQLSELDVQFYRHPRSNIITIRNQFIEKQVAEEFGLVPDNHSHPQWYKIVIMEHVTIEKLIPLIELIGKKANQK